MKKTIIIFLTIAMAFSNTGLVFADEKVSEEKVTEQPKVSLEISKETSLTDSSEITDQGEVIGLNELDEIDLGYLETNTNVPLNQYLTADANLVSGAFVFSYPVQVPPGRNNLTPEIKISYNSQNTDVQSLVGYGWSLNIPYIERLNKTGSDKLYTDNYFISSLSGELVPIDLSDAVHGEYGAKVEDGEFLVYEFIQDNYWKITDKQGMVYTFGNATSTRQDSADHQQVYKWLLEEMRDSNDNYIRFEYYKDQGQIYPSTIIYTGHGQTDGIFEVEFLRESRNDALTAYKTGFAVTTDYRINEIRVLEDGEWIKKYYLNYATGDNGYKSLLESIVEAGKNDQAQEVLMPADEFEYFSSDIEWAEDQDIDIPLPFAYMDGGGTLDNYVRYADINGDGLEDIVDLVDSSNETQTFLNNADGTGWTEAIGFGPIIIGSPLTHEYVSRTYDLLDVNGDYYADIVYTGYSTYNQTPSKSVYINNADGTGWTADSNFVMPVNLKYSLTGRDKGYRWSDINGDGLVDLVGPTVYINNADGTGWTASQTYTIPTSFIKDYVWGGDNHSYQDSGARMVDFNSDGLIDFIKYNSNDPVEVYINNGSNWEEILTYTIPTNIVYGMRPTFSNGVRLYDVNADGLQDFVFANSNDTVTVNINKGDDTGWGSVNDYIPPTRFNINYDYVDSGIRMGDVNGDGLIDYLQSYDQIYQPSERHVYLSEGNGSDILHTINHRQGSETIVTYQGSAEYQDDSGEPVNSNLPFIIQTVKTIEVDDGYNNILTTNYNYKDGVVYFNDGHDRGFSSFGQVEKIKEDTKEKYYFHQGNEDFFELGEEDNYYKKGLIYRTELYQEDNNDYFLVGQKLNKYWVEDLGSNNSYVYLDSEINYDYLEPTEEILMTVPSEQLLDSRTISTIKQVNQVKNLISDSKIQLISNLSSDNIKHYYLGTNEVGESNYMAEFSIPTDVVSNELDEFDLEYDPNRIGYFHYTAVNNEVLWEEAVQAESAPINSNQLMAKRNPSELTRVFLLFNTDNIPDEAYVYDADLFATYVNSWGWRESIDLVDFNPEDWENIVEADYSNFGDQIGSSVVFSGRGTYNFNFSHSALPWISKTDITSIGLRTNRDVIQENDREYHLYFSNPRLVVYYTMESPPTADYLWVNNLVNPNDLINNDLLFSAVYNNDDNNEQAVSYQIQIIQADGDFNNPLWDSGQQNLQTAVNPNNRSENINGSLANLPLEGHQYFWRIKFWNNGDIITSEGLWSDGTDYFYMDGSMAPSAAVGLLTEDRVNPDEIIDLNPEFTAFYIDPDLNDYAVWYRIQVASDSSFNNLVWDSTKTALIEPLLNGKEMPEVEYNGSPLSCNGQTYYWRIKFWDDEGVSGTEGVWSDHAIFTTFNQNNVLTGVKVRAITYNYDLTNGNLLEEENLGEVLAANNGAFINQVGDEKVTDYDYAVPIDPNSNIIAAPKEKVLTDPNTEEESEVELYYDQLPLGQVSAANLTKEDLIVGQTEYQKTFNNYGLVTQTLDPLGQTTSITYEQENLYPAQTINDLNQVITTEYDLATGQMTRTEDPNGMLEERDYDPFGRLIKVRLSDLASSTSLITMETYEYHDNVLPMWQKQSRRIDSNNWTDVYTYLDGLGRMIQVREESLNGNYIVVSYEYSSRGNMAKRSLPYLEAGSSYVAPTWNLVNQPHTIYTYDAKDRVLTEIFQSSTHSYETTYEYEGWNVLITDPEGNQKKLYKDAHDQLIQVDEYLNAQVYSTYYEYNLLGKLINITDALGNVRNFEYDDLGRLISQEEMHDPQAQNFGVWNYAYDDASNLVSRTDPNGNTVNYTYDDLNRILTENYIGTLYADISYEYDTAANGIGRLGKVVFNADNNWSKEFDYDVWGRTTNEKAYVDGHESDMDFEYTLFNQPDKIIFNLPEEYYMDYGYNSLGQTVSLSVSKDDQNYTNLVDDVSYSPLKQITEVSYANGTVSTNNYDPLQAYRLTSKQTVLGATSTQDLIYSYDNVGNITQVVDGSDSLTAKTTAYSYDDLYRLTSASVTNSANNQDYARTYTYDIIGNILTKSDIGTYLYQNDNPYQANSINSQIYTYDDNGNLISDPAQNYSYNYNDRLISVTDGQTATSTYSYDQDGQRIYKEVITASSTLEAIYPNHYLEYSYVDGSYTVPDSITKHLFFGNQRIGQVVNKSATNTISLIFSDHLGSSSVMTDEDGDITAVYDYYPFGGARIVQETNSETDYLFTGQEYDEETDQHYYDQRYYGQNIGRFNRIDPVAFSTPEQVIDDPQKLNYYSYTRNSPIIYVDPTGESGELTVNVDEGGFLGGHAWISYTSDDTGKTTTYGTWNFNPFTNDSNEKGLFTNAEQGRNPDASRGLHIDDDQEASLFGVIDSYEDADNDAWKFTAPCSAFAQDAWEAGTGEYLNANIGFINNPQTLSKSIIEMNGGSNHNTPQMKSAGSSASLRSSSLNDSSNSSAISSWNFKQSRDRSSGGSLRSSALPFNSLAKFLYSKFMANN